MTHDDIAGRGGPTDGNPAYYKPVKPNNCRRAFHHNYKAPCLYMITISKARECPDFSCLTGNPADVADPPRTLPTPTGHIVEQQIWGICENPDFDIENYVIMPDHVHLMWRVRHWLPRDLGYYVGLFKSRCAKIWHEQIGHAAGSGNAPAFFKPKFNDRIAYKEEIGIRFSNYVSDNPRRRLIVMKYPHLFNRRQNVEIAGRIMNVYGNFQLLRHPVISAVVVSSRYSDEERVRLEREWEETIRAGGVFVSPFISKAEQNIMKRAIDEGASIIRILPDGIPPKYKPSGLDFELCGCGRCLHVGIARESCRNERLKRSEALRLNGMARWIASHPAERMRLLRTQNS